MISIVVPIYNGEKYIKSIYEQMVEAASILSEDTQIEMIFVNDGSVDHSMEVLKEISAVDANVKIFDKPNGGIASARNVGLEAACGEYICFWDQDDQVKPYILQVLANDLMESGADFVQAKANSVVEGAEVCQTQVASVVPSYKTIDYGTQEYDEYVQTLVMRGLVEYPDCQVSGSIWCCMFRTEFLRENNISFYRFCDYEDDWIFIILAMVHAKKFCIENQVVYNWVIHSNSESHNRVQKDRYLENFYEKHRLLREFFWEALKNANVSDELQERFGCELQKQALLWSLSNETGRGIAKHNKEEIVEILTQIVRKENEEGIYKKVNRRPLNISVAGASGIKRWYYALRDKVLTFLLLHGQISLAVTLNKKYLHGRWHV